MQHLAKRAPAGTPDNFTHQARIQGGAHPARAAPYFRKAENLKKIVSRSYVILHIIASIRAPPNQNLWIRPCPSFGL